MDTETRIQMLDEAICILHGSNTLEKVWIQLFSPWLVVNSRVDEDL